MQAPSQPSLKTRLAPTLHTWAATWLGVALTAAGTIVQYGPGIVSALPPAAQKWGGALVTIAGLLLTITGKGPYSAPRGT